MTADRFTLEEKITNMLDFKQMIEDIIYKIGDSKNRPTEDELLNALIGVNTLYDFRYEQLWECFEELIKQKIITNKGTETDGG